MADKVVRCYFSSYGTKTEEKQPAKKAAKKSKPQKLYFSSKYTHTLFRHARNVPLISSLFGELQKIREKLVVSEI